MALAEPGDAIQLPDREVGNVRQEQPEPVAVGGSHDTVGYQTIPPGVKAGVPEAGPAAESAPVVLRTSPVADRIRAYVDERQRAEAPGTKPAARFSMSKLSVAAGLHRAQLTMVLRRLDEGADIDTGILRSVAQAMGRSLDWLLRGEESGLRLRDVPGWSDAISAARAMYPALNDKSIQLAGEIIVPRSPTGLEPSKILAFIVGVDAFLGES